MGNNPPSMYKYPLQTDPFTYWDRLKVSAFILNKNNRLTMGKKVEELERKISDKYKVPALAVSSGSAANHLIFELWKQKHPNKFKNALVIVPVVTWMSSISPALMSGYKIEFCDINLNDFSFDYKMLEKILKSNKDKNLIIWPTALIGFCPDFKKLKILAQTYKAELWGDFCENLHSTYQNESIFSCVDISSLSLYMAHQLVGLEMGFVFIKNEKDYELAKTLRNHGLTRSLNLTSQWRQSIEKKYFYIDKQFLFASLGTNWRTTDLNACFALQDFDRIDENKIHSKQLFNIFDEELDKNQYYLPDDIWDYSHSTLKIAENVPFCLPIFRKDQKMKEYKAKIIENGWETRPIIGSCLTLQPVFKKYHTQKFKNALWIHNHGFYVGLSRNLKEKDIKTLTNILNKEI